MTTTAHAGASVVVTRRAWPRAALVAMRPRQWPKNLLLLAAVVFAGRVGDVSSWWPALAALAAYCTASSAAYLVNDVHDRARDLLHPVKRLRPVARGDLSPAAALALAATLACVGLALAALTGAAGVLALVAFLALQGLYTTRLRDVVPLDVVGIAGLFVLRAVAGAIAIDVRISPWLLACTGLLALLLGLGKRHAERASVARHAETRPALAAYPARALAVLPALVGAITTLTYAAYAVTAHDAPLLAVTIPLVGAGIARYLLLVHRHGAGEDPEGILLRDLPTLVVVTTWVATCAVVLGAG